MENLVDATDTSGCDDGPVVTFPDSETPPPIVGPVDLPMSMSMSMSPLSSSANNSSQMLASMNSSELRRVECCVVMALCQLCVALEMEKHAL